MTIARDAVSIRSELRYGPLDNHTLDLYYPPNPSAEPPPIMMYVHGGGWFTGDKDWIRHEEPMKSLGTLLLGSGYAVAAINYRTAEAGRHPHAVEDVISATRWLETNAWDLGLNAGALGLVGDSAGAHLALMAAASGRTAPLRAVVSYYGVIDLSTVHDERRRIVDAGSVEGFFHKSLLTAPTPEGKYLGCEPEDAADAARAASPLHAAAAGMPPTILFAGRGDAVAGYEAAGKFSARLLSLGVDARAVIIDAGHADPRWLQLPGPRNALRAFLSAHLDEPAGAPRRHAAKKRTTTSSETT